MFAALALFVIMPHRALPGWWWQVGVSGHAGPAANRNGQGQGIRNLTLSKERIGTWCWFLWDLQQVQTSPFLILVKKLLVRLQRVLLNKSPSSENAKGNKRYKLCEAVITPPVWHWLSHLFLSFISASLSPLLPLSSAGSLSNTAGFNEFSEQN